MKHGENIFINEQLKTTTNKILKEIRCFYNPSLIFVDFPSFPVAADNISALRSTETATCF